MGEFCQAGRKGAGGCPFNSVVAGQAGKCVWRSTPLRHGMKEEMVVDM